MGQDNAIREDFLREFVKRMIMLSYKEVSKSTISPKIEMPIKKEEEQEKLPGTTPIRITEIEMPKQPQPQIAPPKLMPRPQFAPRYHLSPNMRLPNQKILPNQNQSQFNNPLPEGNTYLDIQALQEEGLGRFIPFLKDPSVLSIECSGPNKQLIINKSGMMQTAQLALNEEEIKEVLEGISKKTRIPLIQGLFKAALGGIIITAVISDFVGSRFVIQKRISSNS